MQEEEIWQPIVGYENLYEISNLGRIRSVDRYVIYPNIKTPHLHKGRYLSPEVNVNGHLRVTLSKNGKTARFFLHRLVASQFCDGYAEGLVVNHKNGIKTDNRYTNLEWCTVADNVKHAVETGLWDRRCERGTGAKLTREQALFIRQNKGVKKKKTLAEQFNVSLGAIDGIWYNRTWIGI